jgi:thymidine kinase
MNKEEENNEGGYLELWTGPMYSGKTSKILEIYKQFNFSGVPTCVINYEEDNRYPDSDTHLSTHDRIAIPCIRAKTMNEIAEISRTDGEKDKEIIIKGKYADKFISSKVILINEGQFFPDIVEWVRTAVDVYNKKVYISGLDGDYERERFRGDWLDLIRYSDKVKKLHSNCNKCKKRAAIFSHRLSNDRTQKMIGAEAYIPLCRQCYLQENKK